MCSSIILAIFIKTKANMSDQERKKTTKNL